ncbi:MAG TPA: AmmeMemoRadiSam system protein B [Methanocorpusculum sp.]|nr:AmmeMemoRadiSam system protein B [Methanocorpusculum sp.]
MHTKIPAEPDNIRHPTLAGMFYPGGASELQKELTSFFESTVTSITNPFGIVVPHAGYIYSGQTAAVSFGKISPDFAGTFVILAPSHQGYPTSSSGLVWETPAGSVSSDTDFLNALDLPRSDEIARRQENSIEVLIPFIDCRFPKAKIVPVLLGDQSKEGAHLVAQAVISAAKATGTHPVIIASSDCSHYVPKERAMTDDLTTLAALKNLDVEAFYAALHKIRPSMCGYGCIAAMAEICKTFGASEARVLLYTTSGEVTGDYDEVVGYAAMEVV